MCSSSKKLRQIWATVDDTLSVGERMDSSFRTTGGTMLDLLMDSECFVEATSEHRQTYTLLWLLHKGLTGAASLLSSPPIRGTTYEEHTTKYVEAAELYFVTLLHVAPAAYTNHLY